MPNKRHQGLFYHHQAFDLEDGTKAGTIEYGLMTCNHCQVLVVLNPERTRAREWCWTCDMYICDACHLFAVCIPAERRVELALKYPNLEEPFMLTGSNGQPLFNLDLYSKERIF